MSFCDENECGESWPIRSEDVNVISITLALFVPARIPIGRAAGWTNHNE